MPFLVQLPNPCSGNRSSLSAQTSLCNPVLAFIKAFRLKGDVTSLKQALSESFSLSEIVYALKMLWDHSQSELESAGFTYQQRRGSDKCPVGDMVVNDILSAFDKLDSSEHIPPIFCEAVDLIRLPPITTDLPAATVHESNLRIRDLQSDMQASNSQVKVLQGNLDSLKSVLTIQSSNLSELKASISNQIQEVSSSLNDKLYSSLHTLSTEVKSLNDQVSSLRLHGKSGTATASTVPPRKSASQNDRSANIIFFGIPEQNLLATRSLVDEICEYLVDKAIIIKDLFRLGKLVQSSGDSGYIHARPVLVKLSSVWDKRLILISKSKLKHFRLSRIFVRPDLSPEERVARKRNSAHKDGSSATGVTDTPTVKETSLVSEARLPNSGPSSSFTSSHSHSGQAIDSDMPSVNND